MADPKSLTVRAQGLNTAQTQVGQGPGSGQLQVADNVVITKQGVWEPRRGVALTATFSGTDIDYMGTYGSLLVLHDRTASTFFLFDPVAATTQTLFGTYPYQSQGHIRVFENNGNLYISSQGGLDALDLTSPRISGANLGVLPGGSPAALDASASLVAGTGSAVPGDSQVAYRFTFIHTEANNQLIEGSPSGRAVVVSPSVVADPGSVSRTSNVVTVTASNNFVSGEKIVVGDQDPVFPSGTFTLSSADAVSFQYTQSGSAPASSSAYIQFEYTAKNVSVGSTIPAQVSALPSTYGYLTNPYRFRVYRSQRSPDASSTPTDDLQLVFEGPVPSAVTAVSMSRAAGATVTVTASTSGNNLAAGEIVYVPVGYAGGAGSTLSIYASSIDAVYSANGVTWATATLTSALSATSLCAGPTKFVVVGTGTNAASTSSDGVVWSATGSSNMQSGSWQRVIHNGSIFEAAGGTSSSLGVYMASCTSSNGALWSIPQPLGSLFAAYNRTGASASIAPFDTGYLANPIFTDIAQNGSQFCAVFWARPFTNPVAGHSAAQVYAALSSDGVTWNGPYLVFNGAYNTTSPAHGGVPDDSNVDYTPHICWDGLRWIITGGTGMLYPGNIPFNFYTHASSNGSSWSAVAGGLNMHFSTVPACRPASDGTKTSIIGFVSGTGTIPLYLPNTSSSWITGSWPLSASLTHSVLSTNFVGDRFIGYLFDNTHQRAVVSSSDGVTWSSTTSSVTAALGAFTPVEVVQLPSNTAVPAGYYTLTAAGGTSMSFASAGGNFNPTLVTPQTVTPITVAVVDNVPDSLLQAALYTNGDITQQNDVPPDAADVVKYRSTTFYASPLRPPQIAVNLIAVGAPSGLQVGDVITVGAGTITAGTSADPLAGTFQVSTSSLDPNQNISDTVASIIRTINVKQGSLGCYAVETSIQSGYPGSFILAELSPLSNAVFSVSANATAWSPSTAQSVVPRRDVSLLAFSKTEQVEAVPVLNSISVGAPGKKILRTVPLRDGLIVFKEDGTFWLTGLTSAQFDVQPLLPNLILKAPETAVFLADTIFALTNQGFVRLTNQGRDIISLVIDDQVQPLLGPDMLAAAASASFGVPYESERTYHVWLPTAATDSSPTQAFSYNLLEGIQAWTKRTDSYVCAIVAGFDNRLWAASGSMLFKERKDELYTDYADSYRGAATFVGYGPGVLQDPSYFLWPPTGSNVLDYNLDFPLP